MVRSTTVLTPSQVSQYIKGFMDRDRLLSGLLATCLKNAAGYPRISVTVPSIVIMVPGLYFYRAIYNLGIMSLTDSATWFADAILIIVALPLGLIFARIITDRTFRYCT